MPGSQSTAGDRNEVWDPERPQSPKSFGAAEWVNDPHAQGISGRGWGTPRCFGIPPFQGHVPLPRAAGERRSTPTPRGRSARLCTAPAPRARTAPHDPAGAGAVPGEGRSGLTGAAAAAAARAPAAVPARLLPPPLAQVRRSAPAPPFFPPNLRLGSRNRAAAGRAAGELPAPGAATGAALEEPAAWLHDLPRPRGPGVPAHSPDFLRQRSRGAQPPLLPGPRIRRSRPPPFSDPGIHASRPLQPGPAPSPSSAGRGTPTRGL